MTDPRCDFKRLLIFIAAGLVMVCISCFMLAVVRTYTLPSEAIAFLTAITTASLGVLSAAAAYEFASSRGSQAKDEVISTLATAKEPPNAPTPPAPEPAASAAGG
jgi:hypothetical protein